MSTLWNETSASVRFHLLVEMPGKSRCFGEHVTKSISSEIMLKKSSRNSTIPLVSCSTKFSMCARECTHYSRGFFLLL